MGRTLSKDSRVPLYFQLKQDLLTQIISGKLKDGDVIPTEKELEKKGISRTTVRRAIDELVNEGYLERVQGKGTFVRIPYVDQYPVLATFSEDMKARGKLPEHHTLHCEITKPPKQVVQELEIDADQDCLHLQRLMKIDENPVGYAETWLPTSIIGDHLQLFKPEVLDPYSIYRILEGPDIGVSLVRAVEVATAEAVNDRLAQLLNLPDKNPVLVIRHVGYSANDQPVDSLKLVFGGTHYQYRTELFRPAGAGWAGRVFIINGE